MPFLYLFIHVFINIRNFNKELLKKPFRLLFIQSISTLCLAKLAYNFHIPFSYDFEAEGRPKDTCET